jgi:Cu-Zn family superoxide dismutase
MKRSLSMKFELSAILLAVSGITGVHATEIVVPMYVANAEGRVGWIGDVTISESPYGLVFSPELRALPPGLHGFHLHQNASCTSSEKDGVVTPAGAAGSHYDPDVSGVHGTPWGDGHRGDLPPLFVDAEGSATQPVLAPRLKLADLPGRALMVHAGGDNHADHPQALGGGGARIACGVIR